MNDFENFKNWIEMGDEVEFTYKGKRYSVTYFVTDSKQD